MTPYHNLYPGQDVVCINADPPPGQHLGLTKDAIYKIRWVGMHRTYLAGEFLGVRLVDVDRPVCPFSGEEDVPFRADRFRPLVHDPLSTLRCVAAGGPVQGDIDGPRRKVEEDA